MPKQVRQSVAGLQAPITTAEMTLVGGQAIETGLVGHDPGAAQVQSVVMIQRRVPGGTIGDLSYVWVPSTGTLTVDSDNALDTSVVEILITGV